MQSGTYNALQLIQELAKQDSTVARFILNIATETSSSRDLLMAGMAKAQMEIEKYKDLANRYDRAMVSALGLAQASKRSEAHVDILNNAICQVLFNNTTYANLSAIEKDFLEKSFPEKFPKLEESENDKS